MEDDHARMKKDGIMFVGVGNLIYLILRYIRILKPSMMGIDLKVLTR